MKRSFLLLVITILSPLIFHFSPLHAEISFSTGTFTFAGTMLPYRYADIHPELTQDTAMLVLYLHGGTSRGTDNTAQLNEQAVSVLYSYLQAHGRKARLIVPQCPTTTSWDGKVKKPLYQLLRSMLQAEVADSTRVYILGGSMGGTGTWKIINSYPELFAAAMPVAGNPTGCDAQMIAAIPVYTVMGLADDIMSVDPVVTFREQVIAAGGVMHLDTEAGWSHQNTCEMSYTAERLNWIFAQRKGQPVIDPAATTDVVITNNQTLSPSAVKIIHNGQLYIQCGNKRYTVTGKTCSGVESRWSLCR